MWAGLAHLLYLQCDDYTYRYLVKDIAWFRPNLKLLISSATLDAEKFSDVSNL